MMHTFCLKNGTAGKVFLSSLAAALLVFFTPFALAASSSTPKYASAFGSFLAGRSAQSKNDVASAARYYADALRSDPDNLSLLQQTYLLLAMDGRVNEAAVLAERILSKDPSSDLALTIAAVQDIKEGRFAEAEKRLNSVSKHDAGAIALRAWATLGAKPSAEQFRKAMNVLSAMEKDTGLSRMYRLHAGMMADVAGQTQEAEKHYVAIQEGVNGLPPYIIEIIGTFYQRHGQIDQAQALYKKFVTPDMEGVLVDTKGMLAAGRSVESPIRTSKDGAAEVLFGVANSVFFSRPMAPQDNEALLMLEQTQTNDLSLLLTRLGLYLRPDTPRSQLLLGDILTNQNRAADANAIYQSINPKAPLAWTGLIKAGENLAFLKKTDEALALLEKAEKQHPSRIEPILSQADILRQTKQWEKAAASYGRAIDMIDPREARNWFLFYGRGISYERSKQWDKAEADLQQALTLNPDQPEVLNYLGYSWIEMGAHLDEAIHMIEKAVAQRPRDGYIIDSLGWAHYRLGEYETAVSILEEAIAYQPQDPTINDHLGDALWQAGRHVEARYQWQRALSFSPEPEDAVKIQKKLDGTPPENIPIRKRKDDRKTLIPL